MISAFLSSSGLPANPWVFPEIRRT